MKAPEEFKLMVSLDHLIETENSMSIMKYLAVATKKSIGQIRKELKLKRSELIKLEQADGQQTIVH